MGFFLHVEAGSEPGHLMTRLSTRGGNAVLSFLTALSVYCIPPEDEQLNQWFQDLQTHLEYPLCEVFRPIIDCMWTDGGYSTGDFLEDEYEWYRKRYPTDMTEAEFRKFIIEGTKHWSPIDAVIANTKLLIDLLQIKVLSNAEGFYSPKDLTENIIPDFESLFDALIILRKYRYEVVRLNFI